MNRIASFSEKQKVETSAEGGLASEAFVQCPAVFLDSLSPEQWVSLKELYQAAYAQAQKQAGNPDSSHLDTDGFLGLNI